MYDGDEGGNETLPPVVDEEVPDETIPPETDETASEEPVQPEGDVAVDVQATSQIIASETSTAYSYIYASGKLLQEKVTTNGATETHNFFYDNTGKPYAMQVNGTTYYYVTNLQGDVMGMVDASGNSVATYTYDPYGKVLTATGALAEKNPLRYRGYYYDSESGLYYLLSRYYDPATRRFINADSYAGTGQGMLGYNMFAYCNNNPLLKLDSEGNLGLAVIAGGLIGGAIAGALIGTVSHLVSSGMKGEQVTAGGILSAAAVGAATGAIGALGGITGTSTVAAIVVGLVSGVTVAINTEGGFWNKVLDRFYVGYDCWNRNIPGIKCNNSTRFWICMWMLYFCWRAVFWCSHRNSKRSSTASFVQSRREYSLCDKSK